MPEPNFVVAEHSNFDKHFEIHGPGDLTLIVVYDDVNQEEVDAVLAVAVEALNEVPAERFQEAMQKVADKQQAEWDAEEAALDG